MSDDIIGDIHGEAGKLESPAQPAWSGSETLPGSDCL
jgi:hypothetical protein